MIDLDNIKNFFTAFILSMLAGSCSHGQPARARDGVPKQEHIRFTPDVFYNSFSLNVNPVLHLHAGDTLDTETIDASGHDKNGMARQKGGNPLTGPFFIDEAKVGDVLKIHLITISLNRGYAITSEGFVSRSMPDSVAGQFKRSPSVRWRLDIPNGMAVPDSSYAGFQALRDFKVPLHPFLGCIGVAPQNNKNEILSFFQGEFGGNMDFSGNCQGATIYLPVLHDGAYLYIGDGHALQGDGEIAGNALETSMDVSLQVDVIKDGRRHVTSPRVENDRYIMVLGVGKTLDKAIQSAGAGLLDWIKENYVLTTKQTTQVLSTSIEYVIAEIADPDVIVVAKIKKALLSGIKTNSP